MGFSGPHRKETEVRSGEKKSYHVSEGGKVISYLDGMATGHFYRQVVGDV